MTVWTPDESRICSELWGMGVSAGRIAIALGHKYTRNAVIGKVKRMGLPQRNADMNRFKSGARMAPKPPKPKPPVVLPDEPQVLGEPNDFPRNGCLWIPGHTGPGFRCCGHPRHANSTYCGHHHAKAVAPSRESKG